MQLVLQGTLTYPAPAKKDEEQEEKPGDKFEGNLVHGQREGKGKYTWSNGCYYDGVYQNHLRHGSGILTMPDKGRYEGWCSHQRSHKPNLTKPLITYLICPAGYAVIESACL